MTRALFIFPLFFSCLATAQVRFQKLIIRPHEVYQMGASDIIVSDTLIMMDSSRIRLNRLKPQNFIRARVAIFGNACVIDGRGDNGKNGDNGPGGNYPVGPCQNGGAGRNGMRGLDGMPGVDLFLYIDTLKSITGLVIDLSGGNGGDGGKGGQGGGGSPGTAHCNGGDGGNGGHGGAGGNGGRGGVLTLGGKNSKVLRGCLGEALTVYTRGGSFGYGGFSGYGGPAGLGPDRRNGKSGQPGTEGRDGHPGNMGTIIFEGQ